MHKQPLLHFVILMVVLLLQSAACATATTDSGSPNVPTAVALRSTVTEIATLPATPSATASSVPPVTPESTLTPTAVSTPTQDPAERIPAGARNQFRTNFRIHSIPYDEIISGGPPKDGIPAIDNPQFVSVSEADSWIGDLEPVTVFQEQEETRIYPFQILMWHEIVNDVVAGRSVVITFCPLCNTAIVFDATVDGRRLDFGTTGRLRFSNLLMYDRQTESWWQQATGEAVVGTLTGSQLTFLPASIVSWGEAREKFPQAQVLSRETGFPRNYGRNPYVGYDSITSSPILFRGETPNQLPAMARVTTVALNGEAVAYPNAVLQEIGVVNDTVGGVDIAIFWQPGLASALDSAQLATGQDVGANGVFERRFNGQTLTFVLLDGRITDTQTNSTWNIFGQAIAGELAGEVLTAVVKIDHFWFSWAAFRPDTRIYRP